MRLVARLTLALLLVLAVASPGLADVFVIEVTMPLQDHSEQSLQTAFKEAVETAVREAVAMGLTRVQLHQTVVLEDGVAVQILAMDMDPDDEEQKGPELSSGPGAVSGQPEKLDL